MFGTTFVHNLLKIRQERTMPYVRGLDRAHRNIWCIAAEALHAACKLPRPGAGSRCFNDNDNHHDHDNGNHRAQRPAIGR
jgi:hypothetical protein